MEKLPGLNVINNGAIIADFRVAFQLNLYLILYRITD